MNINVVRWWHWQHILAILTTFSYSITRWNILFFNSRIYMAIIYTLYIHTHVYIIFICMRTLIVYTSPEISLRHCSKIIFEILISKYLKSLSITKLFLTIKHFWIITQHSATICVYVRHATRESLYTALEKVLHKRDRRLVYASITYYNFSIIFAIFDVTFIVNIVDNEIWLKKKNQTSNSYYTPTAE